MNEKTLLLHEAIKKNVNQPQHEGYYCVGFKTGEDYLCSVFDVDIYAQSKNENILTKRIGSLDDILYYVKKESVPAYSPEILQVFIDVLEELRRQDPDAINEIFGMAVECNENIQNNPLVPVVEKGGARFISALSVINAICKRLSGNWVGMNTRVQKFEIGSFGKF